MYPQCTFPRYAGCCVGLKAQNLFIQINFTSVRPNCMFTLCFVQFCYLRFIVAVGIAVSPPTTKQRPNTTQKKLLIFFAVYRRSHSIRPKHVSFLLDLENEWSPNSIAESHRVFWLDKKNRRSKKERKIEEYIN